MIDLESISDNGINLWSNLLKDVKEKCSKTAHIPICLLVLGNAGSGKSTLIARLQKSDPKYGSGLEFDYIEIKDESIDENKKLNIWISSGDPYHANLLKYALNENNFGYSCCMITVSFSEPWNILDNLEEWLKILKMHIERLKLTDNDIKFFKESLVRHFQEYSEPDLEKENQIILGKRRDNDFNYLHPSITDDSEKYFIPLEEDILENNLGIPIIVVITKTDSLFTLEQEHDYNDDKFDFIQMHLRKICLKYGATLCYTSLKDDRNCDLLLNYLLHRCYGFSLVNAASIIEKDAIFIPTGWDSGKKINILTENLSDDIKKHSYNSLITKPVSIVRANAQNRLTEPEIAEDEQVFLMKQQVFIQRIKSSALIEGNIKDGTKVGSSMNLPTRNRKNLSNSSGSIGNTSSASAQQANEGVLANFFSSLLNKRGVTTGSPTLNLQANSCEILRGDDSIFENDEFQKDDLSSNSQYTSIVNNQESTQLKMTETCDINDQGKIDVSIDLNKCQYTFEILNANQNQLNIVNEESINFKIEENDSNIVCDDDINDEDHFKNLNEDQNQLNIVNDESINFKIENDSHIVCDDNINDEDHFKNLNADQNQLNIVNEESINFKIEENNSHIVCDDNINDENHFKHLNLEANRLSIDNYNEITEFKIGEVNDISNELNDTENILSMCPILDSETNQNEIEQKNLNSETLNSLESENNNLNNKESIIKKYIEITDKFENTEFNDDVSDLDKLKNIVPDKNWKNLEIVNNSIEYSNEESTKLDNESFSNTSERFKNEEIILGDMEIDIHSSNYESLIKEEKDIIKNIDHDNENNTKTPLKDQIDIQNEFKDSDSLTEVENKDHIIDENTMIPDSFNLDNKNGDLK